MHYRRGVFRSRSGHDGEPSVAGKTAESLLGICVLDPAADR